MWFKNIKINQKYIIAGWAAVLTLFIMVLIILNERVPKTAEEMNGYLFSWEDTDSTVQSKTDVWVFADTRIATVTRSDLINSNYIPDTKQKYSIKLTEDDIFMILDVYQKKKSTGRDNNTEYDLAVINAMNILKNGNSEEAQKELQLILQNPQ